MDTNIKKPDLGHHDETSAAVIKIGGSNHNLEPIHPKLEEVKF